MLENGDRMTGEVKKLTRGGSTSTRGTSPTTSGSTGQRCPASSVLIDTRSSCRTVNSWSENRAVDGRRVLCRGRAVGGTARMARRRQHAARRTQILESVDRKSPPLEVIVGANFSMFRFKTTPIDTNFAVYPNLSTAGRVRLSAKPNIRLELVRNLYWSFYLYENYDSKPPVDAPRNDFGVTSSFGWKF